MKFTSARFLGAAASKRSCLDVARVLRAGVPCLGIISSELPLPNRLPGLPTARFNLGSVNLRICHGQLAGRSRDQRRVEPPGCCQALRNLLVKVPRWQFHFPWRFACNTLTFATATICSRRVPKRQPAVLPKKKLGWPSRSHLRKERASPETPAVASWLRDCPSGRQGRFVCPLMSLCLLSSLPTLSITG